MRICHITPLLWPQQTGIAQLPIQLGQLGVQHGDEISYVAHELSRGPATGLPSQVTFVPHQNSGSPLARLTRISAITAAMRIRRAVASAVEPADIVHVHGGGLLAEVGAIVAARQKPVVLSLYGPELWAYRRRRYGADLFARAFRGAAHVTFRSQGLSVQAQELGFVRRETSVIYPAVNTEFTWHDAGAQAAARSALGLRHRHVLLNVRQLQPWAGQRHLIEALGEVIRTHPDTRLIMCGAGPLLSELKTAARTVGVEGHVMFAGLIQNRALREYYAAADAFVLPSLTDVCPTAAIESLACGTPVIASDNLGGVELNDLFGTDVTVAPREKPLRLARVIVDLLENKRRTRRITREAIERDFRPAVIGGQFRAIYQRVLASARQAG